MSDNNGKNRKNGFFSDDFVRDFSDIIEQMLDSLGIDPDMLENEPFIYGFSVTNCAGKDPEFREFDNFPDESDQDFNAEYLPAPFEENKPLVDVMEIGDNIHVTAEIPGVGKEDISITATDSFVELHAARGKNSYSELIPLPAKTDPGSAKATYRNGVLEIILPRLAAPLKVEIGID